MNWAKNVFVRNAELYEMVLEGMWEKGEEDALAISSILHERGMGKSRILDVPCGTGRVGLPLAQLGFSVEGIDFSPHLVQVAKTKAKQYRVEGTAIFQKGDMSELDSAFHRDAFDCAINVFTSIGYGSEQVDLDFFKGVRAVVRKGGLFIISGLRNRDYIVGHPAQNVYEESKNLLVLDSYSFDLVHSRERGTWRFYLKVKDVMKFAGEFPIDIRVYSPHELISMLERSGWALSGLYDSLSSKGEFNPASPVYSVLAEAV
jgi:SAM-dependent methyltransferase